MRQSFTTQPALFALHELFEHPALAALDDGETLIDWARVEAIFGHWKRHWGPRGTRLLGLAKMRILTGLAAIG